MNLQSQVLIMEDSPPPPSPIKHEPEPEPVKLETPPPITPVIKPPKMEEVLPTPPPPRPLPTQPRAAIAAAAATAEKPEVSIPTGPRQPRGRGAARGGMPTQAQGRSPPRGPRGDREQRFLPRGRGGRRGMPLQPGTFSNATQLGPVSKYPSAGPSTPATPTIEPLPVPEKKEPQIVLPPLPTIPPWELRFQAPERTDLIATLNNGRLHRAALKKQYADPDKNPRRAEIELELATIDWRATESRTMTMHMQVELARAGKFGIDYKAPEEVITVL
ncbi:hypothetical protein C8F01DRAFT_1242514 [Mycena amicta]|nr:hypothetical protein C8F01DRAFT_1242514 [Mycena amicta]